MNSKTIIMITFAVAVLAAVIVLSDDSDADAIAGYLEPVPEDSTKYGYLTLEAGKYYIMSLEGSSSFHYGESMVAGMYEIIELPDRYDCYITCMDGFERVAYTIYEVHTYKVYGPGNDYSKDYTKFPLKAGSVEVFMPLHDPRLRIVVGMEYFSSGDYIPYDTDSAFFMTNDPSVSTVDCYFLTQDVPDEYEHKTGFYSKCYNAPYSTLRLDVGKYELKFSRNGYLYGPGGLSVSHFSAGEKATVDITEAGEYYLGVSPFFIGPSAPLLTYYSISPEIPVHHIDGSELESVSSSTTYIWYLNTVSIGPGEHTIYERSDCSHRMYIFTDVLEAERFRNDFIDKYMTLIPENVGQQNSDFTSSGGQVWIYTLVTSYSMYGPTYVLDDTYLDYGTRLTECKEKFIYLPANSVSKIGVRYDDSKYIIYLRDYAGTTSILPNDILVDVSTNIAKEYFIVVEPVISDSAECFNSQYELYMDGPPEPDNNGMLFALLSIGLCALFFGLLLYSGKKPRWKD